MSELARWDNFYVIVGSAAGALIGLQFVVLTLVAQRPAGNLAEAGAAFGSPTIVHFSVVLFLSVLPQAPWGAIRTVAILWGIVGFGGILYSLIVMRRLAKQSTYKPQLEDWIFHVLLPLAAYAMLAASSFQAQARPREVLFFVAGTALLLLFVGIHNAWDSVSYHVFVNVSGGPKRQDPKE